MNRVLRTAAGVSTLAVACWAGFTTTAWAQPSSWDVSISPPPEWPAIPDSDYRLDVPPALSSATLILPHPGGHAIAFATRKGLRDSDLRVEVRDLASRKQLGVLDTPQLPATLMSISPTGRKFAFFDFVADPKRIRIIDVATAKELTSHDPFEKAGFEFFGFIDDHRLLLIPNRPGVESLVWNTASGNEVRMTLEGRLTRPNIMVAPAGDYLVIGDSSAHQIAFVDTTSGSTAGSFDCRAEVPHCKLLFHGLSTDGQRLAAVVNASSQSSMLLWDTATGELTDKFPLKDDYTKKFCKYRHVQWCPGGRALWLNGNQLVDLEKKQEVFQWESNRARLAPRPVSPTRVLYLHDELRGPDTLVIEQLARSAAPPPASSPESTADPRRGNRPVPSFPVQPRPTDRTACRAVSLPDVGLLENYTPPVTPAAPSKGWTRDPIPLCGFTLAQQAILFSDAAHGKVVVEGRQSEGSVNDYFRDLRTVFCDRYDLSTGQRDGTFGFPTSMHIQALDPSGRCVAARAVREAGDLAFVFDFDRKHTVAMFQPYGDPNDRKTTRPSFGSIQFVDQQHVLTDGLDGRVTLWQLPECRAVYEITTGVLRGPVLSPDRKTMIVLTDAPRRFVMVEAATGKPLGALSLQSIPDEHRVWAFSYSPDGANFGFVATDRYDGKATLRTHRWSLTDRNERLRALYTLPCRNKLLWTGPARFALIGTGPTEPGAGADLHIRDPGLPTPVRGRGTWEQITSQRISLLDLDAAMVAWHFELHSGCCATSTIGNRLWYVNGDQKGYHLRSLPLPEDTAWQRLVARSTLPKLVKAGDPVGLAVDVADTVPAERRSELTDRLTASMKKRITKAGWTLALDGEEARGRLTYSLLFKSAARDEAAGIARFTTPSGKTMWESKCLFVSKRSLMDSATNRKPQPIPVRDPLDGVCRWVERSLKIPDTFVDFPARQKGIGVTQLSGSTVEHKTF